jgi:hypothetical protein
MTMIVMMMKATIVIIMETRLTDTPVGTTSALYGSNFDKEISYPEGLPSQNY